MQKNNIFSSEAKNTLFQSEAKPNPAYSLEASGMRKSEWQKLADAGELMRYLETEVDRPARTIEDIAIKLCLVSRCEDCPVSIFGADTRTEYEKTKLHAPCQDELAKWIRQEAKKEPEHKPLSLENAKFTAKEMASMLDGGEYLKETSEAQEKLSKDSGLVIVFGYSDDNVELRGAIDDEIGAFDGTTIEIVKEGDEFKAESVNKYPKNDHNAIYAEWCEATMEDEYGFPKRITWSFRTDIPHETFMIYEDEEPFCRGIVFSLDDIE